MIKREYDKVFEVYCNMINCDMIEILKLAKYDKLQYDKHCEFFYHMALQKNDKKKPMGQTRYCVIRSWRK